MIALAQSAEAKIVYTKTYITIGKRLSLNLDHYGRRDFAFSHYSYTHRSTTAGSLTILRQFQVKPEAANGVVGGGYAAALKAGVRIGPHQKFQNDTQIMFAWQKHCSRTASTTCHSRSSGNWKDVMDRYLGLKFFVAGKVHYGWARLNETEIYATLTGYAYETIPNKPIIAGKTHGKDVITLQGRSLGHLARGASAIPAWR